MLPQMLLLLRTSPNEVLAELDRLRHRLQVSARSVAMRVIQVGTGNRHVRSAGSRMAIDFYSNATVPRPYPFSMLAEYTSWQSLNDRTYTGRHLPWTDPPADLPTEADVTALFARGENREILSDDTTATFAFFAQWFTDSFLRTDPYDWRKNTSNHGIDLCQIYGLIQEKTDLLRAHGSGSKRGRLRSQIIDGQEYPEFLFERREPGAQLTIRPGFEKLHDNDYLLNRVLAGASEGHKERVFAVGLENGNSTIGHTMFNVVFVREHNRIAGVLAGEHQDWADDQVFETTRNIMIVVFLKLVIEEYIKHIGPDDFPIELVPYAADKANWNRQNWITIEFNLLYRWHSMVPSQIGEGENALRPDEFVNNNPLVLERGIEELITQSSKDRAAKICLHNTPDLLMGPLPGIPEGVMAKTIHMMREAKLASFNDYRQTFDLPRLGSFDDLTDDAALRTELEKLYGHIDNLEWYVGLFAEQHGRFMMMGDLMGIMVGHDAFTQALTNPLLAPHIFNEKTFTQTGLDIFHSTNTLQQIFERNTAHPDKVVVEFGWEKPDEP